MPFPFAFLSLPLNFFTYGYDARTLTQPNPTQLNSIVLSRTFYYPLFITKKILFTFEPVFRPLTFIGGKPTMTLASLELGGYCKISLIIFIAHTCFCLLVFIFHLFLFSHSCVAFPILFSLANHNASLSVPAQTLSLNIPPLDFQIESLLFPRRERSRCMNLFFSCHYLNSTLRVCVV